MSGRLIKNSTGKAYFIISANKNGKRYPVLGTPKRGGGYIFNKSMKSRAQNFNTVVQGRKPIG